MQFIEKSSLGVRAAVYHLQRRDSSLEYVLFPMIHIGSREYYASVREKLSECDCIVAEGVASRRAFLLTLSYRVVGKIRPSDLVTQDEMDIRSLGLKLLHPDMTGAEFDKEWGHIPWKLRMVLYLILPLVVLYMLFFGTKRSIAKLIGEVTDMPSRDEIFFSGEPLNQHLDKLILHQRDAKLIRQIKTLQNDHDGPRRVIGIVYGAMHMRAVAELLLHHYEYHVSKADWVTVFEF